MNTETTNELILLLGEKKILQLHKLLGRVPFSVAMLVRELRRRLWLSDLKTKKFKTVPEFAKAYGVSPRTVYRALKKIYNK